MGCVPGRTLRYRARPLGPKETTFVMSGYFDNTALVDLVGKKKYLVVRDSTGVCLCTRTTSGGHPGEPQVLFAMFPAPPASVSTITVLFPGGPVSDVPISR